MAKRVKTLTLGLILLICSFFGALIISGTLSFSSNRVEAEESSPFDYTNPIEIDDWEGEYNYTLDNNGRATITSPKHTNLYHYTIPATIYGHPVVMIGDRAFQNNSSIKTLYFRADYDNDDYYLTAFGVRSFDGCNNLELIYCDDYSYGELGPNNDNFTLPWSLEEIQGNAFSYCSKLGRYRNFTLNLPSNLYYMEDSVFRSCSKLTSVNLRDTQITNLWAYTFAECSSLSYVYLPNNLDTIQNYVFQNCDKLTNINLSSTNLQSLYSYTFRYCNNLTDISLPNTLEEIFPDALRDTSIENLTVPNSVSTIGKYAFPRTIKNITLPRSFSFISCDDQYCNPNNNSYSSWPNHIWDIAETFSARRAIFADMFANAENDYSYSTYKLSLDSISFHNGSSSDYVLQQGILYNDDMTDILIATNAFNSNTYNMPNSVRSISAYAFAGNKSIDTVNFGNNAEYVGEYAFYCSKITAVSMNNNCSEIGNGAFAYCSDLVSVTLPWSINDNYTRNYVTYNSYWSNGQIIYTSWYWYSSSGDCANSMFNECKSLTSVRIPNGWWQIPSYMFAYCSNLETVEFGTNITTIRGYAFGECKELENVGDMTCVERLEWGVFYKCKKLQQISSLDNIEYIGSDAFYGCTALTSLTFGRYLNDAEVQFEYSSGIQNIYVDSNNEYYSSVNGVMFSSNESTLFHMPSGRTGSYVIPAGVTTIGEYAFYTSKLTSVDWSSDDLTEISRGAFQASKITGEIRLGFNHLTKVGEYAFQNCSNITKVIFSDESDGIDIVPDSLFYGCNNLSEVVFNTNDISYIGHHSFHNTAIKEIVFPEGVNTLYDPFGSSDRWSGIEIYIDYVKIPSTTSYYVMCNKWSSTESVLHVSTLELSEGIQTFNTQKYNSNSDYYYVIAPDYCRIILPSTLTTIQQVNIASLGILEIHGSVNEGTRSAIVNPVNCEIYGKVLVPAADYDLYYNSSAWANFKNRLVTSINPVVTFVNTMGGSFDDVSVEYGGVVANPGTPTCDYDSATFMGWYWNDPTQDNASVPYDFSTKLYYDVTLYAKWTGIPADRYLTYSSNGDGTYTIVGYDDELCNFSEVIIPSYHPDDHGKITRIAPHTFDRADIQALVFIPGSDIRIDSYAFMNCMSLTSVDLNGVNYIGNCAFMNCSRLTELTIPASVAYVGNSAFANCMHLTTVTWESGDNILAGDSGGFINRDGEIGINTSNSSFREQSWWYKQYKQGNYSYLYQTSLETNIFANCKRLTTVTLPDNMYVIPTRMFNNCSRLTTINLGLDLYRLGTHAFENCTALQTIILPDNLHEIGNFAFENCDLRTITIPLSVNKIGYNPFLKNKNMQYIYVDSLNETYTSLNGLLCYIDGENSFSLVAMPEKLVTAQLDFDEFLPSYVVDFTIYHYALAYNNTIKSVTFPSVRSLHIGRSSFYNCAKLAVIMFNSEYVGFINDGSYQEAFYGCNKLSIIMFKAEVSSVPSTYRLSAVFNQPSNQVSVYVPTSNYDDFCASQWAMFNIVKFDITSNDIFIVIFELNGGEGISAVVVAEGKTINVDRPTKTGYTFDGWYVDEDLHTKFAMSTPITENMILYAKWNLLPYKLIYHWNGGTTDQVRELDETNEVIFYITDVADNDYNPVNYRFITPTKYGHIFVGWYMDENFTTSKYSGITIDDMTVSQLRGNSPIHIYARWEQITYMINIQADDNKYAIGFSTDSTNPVGHGTNVSFSIIFKEAYTQNVPDNLTLTATKLADNTQTTLEAWDNNGIWYYTIEDVQSSYDVTIVGVKINTYLVSFVSQHVIVNTEVTQMPQKITIEHGKSINSILTSSLSTPIRLGYTFDAWYAQHFDNVTGDIVYDDFEYDFNTPITNDTTISSSWNIDHYTISLVLNGGTLGNDSSDIQTIDYTIESDFLLPYNTDFTKNITRTGYTFGGWFAEEDFSGEEVIRIEQGTTGPLTFYANWIPIPYQIEYTLNGGMFTDNYVVTYTIEDLVTLPIPSRGGFSFGGWNDREDLTGNVITQIPVGTIGRKHFYAMWNSNVYNINYYLNGSVYSQVVVETTQISHTLNYFKETFLYGDAPYLITNISRVGYTFGGWYESSDFSGEAIVSVPADRDSDVTIFAKWTPITYTITFNANDAEKIADGLTPLPDVVVTLTYDDITANHGSMSIFGTFDMNNELEWNELHKFVGWFTSATGGTRYTSITPQNLTNTNITLFAHWVANVYNLYILPGTNVDLGEFELSNIIHVVGGNGELDKVYGEGLSFMVLINNPAYTKSEVSVDYKIGSGTLKHAVLGSDDYFTISDSITNNLTLYINNLVVNTYTITFNSAGGTEIAAISNITHGNIVSAPSTTPTKEGYTFAGWYFNGTNTAMSWANAIVADIDLYAKYTLNPLTARIISGIDDLTLITTLNFDAENFVVLDRTIEAMVPIVPGYQFDYFEYNNQRIVNTQGIKSDITIKAVYHIVTYTISYAVDSGYIDSTNPTHYDVNYVYYTENDEVKHASSFTLRDASKTNYTFMGWFYGPANSRVQVTEIPFSYQGNIVYENLTLVAQFVRTSDSYREVTFYDGEKLLYSLSIYAGNRISNESQDIQDKISEMSRLEKTGYVNTGKWFTDEYFRNEFDFNSPINLDTVLYLKYNLINYWITYSYKVEDGNYGVYSNISAAGVVNFNPNQYNVESDILLDSISLAGYRFTGWFYNNEPIERISYQSDGHMGNMQIVGKFEYVTYNILYSIEPGYRNNSANPTSYKVDDEMIILQDAVAVAGYHFVKWVLTTDVNTQITQIDPKTMQNYYITAVFEQDKKYVYIELYTDGVKFSEVQNEENTLLTPPTRTREGYLLDGWYVDAEYTTKYDFSTPTLANGKLYSRFIAEEYYITYAANIVLSSSNTFPEYSSYYITDSIQIPGMQNETGYTFVGWYTGAVLIDGQYNFDNAVAFNGIIVNRTGDIDLVARFNENVYDIIYKLDGGTNNENNPTTITYNSPIIVLRNPEKVGYTFVGWTRETADGEEPITMIPSLSTENFVIKANFTKNKESIIVQRRIWRGGMLYSLPEQTIQLNSSGKAFINNIIPTEDGYVFDTWYSDKDCTNYFNLNTQYSDDVIMYGRFMPVQYAITYLYNVGDTQTPTNPTSFAYNGYPFVLKDPAVLAGYKFDAWYTGVEVTETGYNFANATRVTSLGDTPGDVEVVAKYNIVTYRINYYLDVEGAENNPSNPTSFTVLDNGMKLYNAIAPEGYKFLGWFDSYDREVTEISANMSGDLDITGKFEQEQQPVQVNTNRLYYILIAIGGIGIFFTAIIVVVVLNGNRRKALDEKRISSLLQQINDVVNKRDKQ